MISESECSNSISSFYQLSQARYWHPNMSTSKSPKPGDTVPSMAKGELIVDSLSGSKIITSVLIKKRGRRMGTGEAGVVAREIGRGQADGFGGGVRCPGQGTQVP